MADVPQLTWREVLLLVAILALAAGLRAGYLITCADNAQSAGPLVVETAPPELETLVQNLKEKHRFAVHSPLKGFPDVETAHVSPGYPYLIAAVGQLTDDSALPKTMRWIQCALGALTAGLYMLFARRGFRSSLIGVLVGLLCALHPFWIIDTATLTDGVVVTFLLGLVLFLGVRARHLGGPLSSFSYGLALAALALVRAALLPFAFVSLAWFLLGSRTLARGWLAALLAFLGFINGLAPWIFRNAQQFGDVLPVADSTYYHLWVGNNPHALGGPSANQQMLDYHVLAQDRRAKRDSEYARMIRQEMTDHPAETVRRRLLAGLYFLFGERWFKQERLAEPAVSTEAMPTWLAWSYPVILESTLLVLVALGLLGWRWTYAWRFRAMPLTLALIWIPLPYILSHAEAFSGPRLPLDGVLLTYVAFVLACLFPERKRLWAGESFGGTEPEMP
jgi:hypothetical protein